MIEWLEDALFSIFGTIIACILGIFVIPFVGDDGLFPKWFAWAGQQYDTLDGDAGWKSRVWVNKLPRYLRRLFWLWRNPAQILDASMGAIIVPNSNMIIKGNPAVSDQPHFVPGWCYAKIGKYWMLYICIPTFPKCCLRVYCGWKLMDVIHNPAAGDPCARVSIGCNPFMTRGTE